MLKAWKVISCLVLLAVTASPIVTQVTTNLWPMSIILAVYFWPGTAVVGYRSIKHRQLPTVVGGPSFLQPWQRHYTPAERLEPQRRDVPYN